MMEKIVHSENNCLKKIEIRVPMDELQQKFDKLLDKLALKAEIPGFRPGKAPRQMLVKRYGDAIIGDMGDEFIQLGYKEAIKENNLVPLVPPALETEPKLVLGEDYVVTILVDVKPPIEVREYKDIPLIRKVAPVTDENLEEAINELLRRSGHLAPIEDRTSQTGDYAFVEFLPNGETEASKRVLVLDEKTTVTLLNKKQGDIVEGHFDFPPTWPDKELAGNIYDAKITILELKKIVPAVLDEDFMLQFGEEIKDEAAFRDLIRKDMEKANSNAADKELRKKARAELSARNPIELSDKIIEQAMLRTIHNYWKVDDLSPEQLEEIKKGLRPKTVNSMIADFVIEEIIKLENIKVGKDEIKEKVADVARANNVQPDTLYRHWEKEGNIDDVRDDILAEKAIDLIIENAQITEE